MRFNTLFLVGALAALFALTFSTDRAIADEGNAIGVCCAWDGNLADGDLTYRISGGNATVQALIRAAVEEWDTSVSGLTLTEVTGTPNIEIKFKQGGGLIQGMARRQFNRQGFVRGCSLNIAGSFVGFANDAETLEQIAKHEVGHCLGPNHANFDGDLMSPTLSGGSLDISQCDVQAVRAANHWKLIDGVNTPHQPHVNHVHCG